MSWLVVLLLVIVLIVVAIVAVVVFLRRHHNQPTPTPNPNPTPTPTGTSCASVSQCPPGTAECRSIGNQPPTCNATGSGTGGVRCGDPFGVNSCAAGLTCDLASSTCLIPQGGTCALTTDCASGLVCFSNRCLMPDPPPPVVGCSSTTPCAGGQVCDPFRMQCIPLGLPCSNVGTCPFGLVCGTDPDGNPVCLSPPGGYCRSTQDCSGVSTCDTVRTQSCAV